MLTDQHTAVHMVVGGCDDGTMHMWNVDTGELLFSQVSHGKALKAMTFMNGILATCSASWEIKIWQWVPPTDDVAGATHQLLLVGEKQCPGVVHTLLMYDVLIAGNLASVSMIVGGDAGVYRSVFECQLSLEDV